ncbi:ATP-binding protein [Brachybacterium sp. DNPG3]
MSGAAENFQVDLRGIVEILSHNLYSSPRVYVRELIQNARDAVVARGGVTPPGQAMPRSEGISPAEGLPPVELIVDPERGELMVRDYGVGLTEADARNLLSTIGASSKREELAAVRREFLGQFGIGLLSCFLVADRIEVTSLSALDPQARTMHWVGHGDGTFTVGPAAEPLTEPGSLVRVRARADDAEWVRADRVHALAREYASLLDIPITFAVVGDPRPAVAVSEHPAPWDLTEQAAAGWCEDAFGFVPLTSIPVDVPLLGLRGIAFVTGAASPGRGRAGDRVFSHGMAVAADNTQLVPEWVSFARVAVEAGSLGLTASRESLNDSAALEAARTEIGDQIRAGIESLATGEPEVFSQFVEVHGQSLLALAVAHPQMLDFVARHLTWETSAGPMRLVEMPARITITADDREFSTYAPLVQAQGDLLVNGSYTHGAAMLRAYDQAQDRLTARDFALSELLERLAAPRAEDADLAEQIGTAARRVLDMRGVAVEVRSFRPVSRLVLHVPGRAAGFVFDDADDDPWAELLGGASDGAGIDGASSDGSSIASTTVGGSGVGGAKNTRPTLVLNLRAEAVRALGGNLAAAARDHAIQALHLLSLLQAGIRLHAEEQAELATALETLLLSAATTTTTTTSAPRSTTKDRG